MSEIANTNPGGAVPANTQEQMDAVLSEADELAELARAIELLTKIYRERAAALQMEDAAVELPLLAAGCSEEGN